MNSLSGSVRHIGGLEQLVKERAQGCRANRLPPQQVSSIARLAQTVGADIAADEDGRDRLAELPAQALDCRNAGISVRKMKIRNDEIGRTVKLAKFSECAACGTGRDHEAIPAS